MKSITVFTPTYNRAYILSKCYRSLERQTCMDFDWLIIDDGSTDNTRELVENWQQKESRFDIRYIYKENGGLHTGYNTAISNINTELSVCIDSDDAMPNDAIEQILNIWHQVEDASVAGLIGLDYDQDGRLIGKFLPEEPTINAISLMTIPGSGDKKYVFRTDLLKTIAPMPVFHGEKNFNPHYFVIRLSHQYRFKPINQCFCLVEYQYDGMSANIWKQYFNSPNSFAEYRRALLQIDNLPLWFRLKTAIHYVASTILAKQQHPIRTSPAKLLTLLGYLPGVVLAWLISYKMKKDP